MDLSHHYVHPTVERTSRFFNGSSYVTRYRLSQEEGVVVEYNPSLEGKKYYYYPITYHTYPGATEMNFTSEYALGGLTDDRDWIDAYIEARFENHRLVEVSDIGQLLNDWD